MDGRNEQFETLRMNTVPKAGREKEVLLDQQTVRQAWPIAGEGKEVPQEDELPVKR